MTRLSLITLSFPVCLLLGCKSLHLGEDVDLVISGVVIEAPPGTYTFHSLELPLPLNQTVISSDIVKVEISQRKWNDVQESVAFFGPEADNLDAKVEGTIVWDDVDLIINKLGSWGSIYDVYPVAFSGPRWRIISPWVAAQAYGSECAVQIVNANLQRVFFLDGNSVKVNCLGGDMRDASWINKDSYLDITLDPAGTGNCIFDGDPTLMGPIPDRRTASTSTGEVKAFYDHLKAIKTAAP